MRIREAREGDAATLARVLVDSWRVAHREHLSQTSLMKFTYEESERNWARTLGEINREAEGARCIYVAEDDSGQAIGLAMGGPERRGDLIYTGEVYVLYILPAYHRQGIGRQLMVTIVQRLAGQGMHSLLIRVLKANAPARRFYEALGGQLVFEEQIEEDGEVLDQVAYGWTEVDVLLPHL